MRMQQRDVKICMGEFIQAGSRSKHAMPLPPCVKLPASNNNNIGPRTHTKKERKCGYVPPNEVGSSRDDAKVLSDPRILSWINERGLLLTEGGL
jgi:hypothetical protein